MKKKSLITPWIVQHKIQLLIYASINVKPGGGGDPQAYVGHLTFQENFWSKSPVWAPKMWSNQIKYPQVFDEFIMKMSSEK